MTLRDNVVGTSTEFAVFLYAADNALAGFSFIAAGSYIISRIDLPLTKAGTPQFNIKAAIWGDSGSTNYHPTALIGTASNELDANTLPTSDPGTGAWTSFTGLSASLTNGTRYHVLVYKSSGTSHYYNDSANWYQLAGLAADITHESTDFTTWSEKRTYIKTKFALYEDVASGPSIPVLMHHYNMLRG